MATYHELMVELRSLQGQAEEARLAEKAEVLEKIRALIIEHRLLPEDLGLVPAGKRRAGPAVDGGAAKRRPGNVPQ